MTPVEASPRETYGKTLVELGRENPNIVVLDADLSRSTMTQYFAREFPDRFFDCGLAEQNMIGIAAGLAACGKTVFASTFAVFAPGRCYDQIRMCLAQPHLNVKIVSTHAGITVGEDGSSHQAIEDLALATTFPGFTVISPADSVETDRVIRAAAANPGPFYIRICRPKVPNIYPPDYRFEIGKATVVRPGSHIALIATGVMVHYCMKAAEILAADGVDCRVVNISTIKPLDEAAIIQAARETGAVVTAEDHLDRGGLGDAVARTLLLSCPVPFSSVGMKDAYAKSGRPDELVKKYGLAPEDLAREVRRTLAKKSLRV
ncbi:MAG: transketolase family protein [Chloroflexi bacterium]|nr:transketolase family protein [Chloroflexota bacterium]